MEGATEEVGHIWKPINFAPCRHTQTVLSVQEEEEEEEEDASLTLFVPALYTFDRLFQTE